MDGCAGLQQRAVGVVGFGCVYSKRQPVAMRRNELPFSTQLESEAILKFEQIKAI
jgi:hypothetical protein